MSKGGGYSSQDAYHASAAQSAANTAAVDESAKVNAIDQHTPYGTLTYTRDKNGVPTSSNYVLNNKVQQMSQNTKDLGITLSSDANKLADNLPTTPFTPVNTDVSDISNAMYDRRMQQIQPELDQARKETNVTLSDRGIPIGSEVYRNEQNRMDRMENEQQSAITNDAKLAAGAESDRRLAQQLTLRAQPFNEVSAFAQGSPAIATAPMTGGQTNYQVQAPDIGSYLNQAAQSRQSQSNSTLGGLFGLGSAALYGFSDRRLKKDVKKIGSVDKGLNLYTFRYKSQSDDAPKTVGFMSDEVREVVPDAVMNDPSGYDKVDYSRVVEAA